MRLAGASYFEGLDHRTPRPVPVLMPHHARLRGPEVRVERTRLPIPSAVWHAGVPCVPGELALLHELRHHALRGVGLETFTVVGGDSDVVQVERMTAPRGRALWLPPSERRWHVGAFVPVPALVVPDVEEVAREQIMLEHYADLERRRAGEPSGRSRA